MQIATAQVTYVSIF